MMNGLIAGGIGIAALCAGLFVFKMEARQNRKSVLDCRSYRFGFLGMVVYLVMYGVLTVIEKACFGIGKVEVLPEPGGVDVLTNPIYANAPGNIYNDDSETAPLCG